MQSVGGSLLTGRRIVGAPAQASIAGTSTSARAACRTPAQRQHRRCSAAATSLEADAPQAVQQEQEVRVVHLRPDVRQHHFHLGCRAVAFWATATLLSTVQVTIRRRPPSGFQQQGCGPMKFRTEKNDGNTPRNILEEIIWWVASAETCCLQRSRHQEQLIQTAADSQH